jgi:hypothetical protein
LKNKTIQFFNRRLAMLEYSINRLYSLRLIWLIPLVIILIFVGGLFQQNFDSAMTPTEAIEQGYPPMPAHWEVGVFNHGNYFKWYTVESNPVLYYVSWVMLLSGVIGLFGLIIFVSVDYLIGEYRKSNQG